MSGNKNAGMIPLTIPPEAPPPLPPRVVVVGWKEPPPPPPPAPKQNISKNFELRGLLHV